MKYALIFIMLSLIFSCKPCEVHIEDVEKSLFDSYSFFLFSKDVSLKHFPFQTIKKLHEKFAGDYAQDDIQDFAKAVQEHNGYKDISVKAYIEQCTKKLPSIPQQGKGVLLCNINDAWFQLNIQSVENKREVVINRIDKEDDIKVFSLNKNQKNIILCTGQNGTLSIKPTPIVNIASQIIQKMKEEKYIQAVIYATNEKLKLYKEDQSKEEKTKEQRRNMTSLKHAIWQKDQKSVETILEKYY